MQHTSEIMHLRAFVYNFAGLLLFKHLCLSSILLTVWFDCPLSNILISPLCRHEKYHKCTPSFQTFYFILFQMAQSQRYWKYLLYSNMRPKKKTPKTLHCLLPVVTNLIYFITSARGANVHPPTHVPIWWHGWGTALFPRAMCDTQIVGPGRDLTGNLELQSEGQPEIC